MTKILLIEDNELNRDMLRRRLDRRGYAVVAAENGQQGLLAAHAEEPDVILMDMSLPGMDGWTLARLLKAESATRRIPIIALTAHAMPGDRETALQAGCDDYDTKPVVLGRLLSKIEALVLARDSEELVINYPATAWFQLPSQPVACGKEEK